MKKDSPKFTKALSFIKKQHAGQFRDNGLPAWHHLLRVSRILSHTLEETKEGTPEERNNLPLAALGHDIFEDTKATEAEIQTIFGNRGLVLIQGMTNWWGDGEKPKYIKQICASEEAVRLIKLADLCDNYTSVVYNIKSLGVKWSTSYFLPIVRPMREAIIKTRFKKFKKSSEILIPAIHRASLLLEEEITQLSRPKHNM